MKRRALLIAVILIGSAALAVARPRPANATSKLHLHAGETVYLPRTVGASVLPIAKRLKVPSPGWVLFRSRSSMLTGFLKRFLLLSGLATRSRSCRCITTRGPTTLGNS